MSESRESKAHYKDHGPLDCKVYIGGLGDDANRYEIWDEFEKYGTLRNVWVARNPPGFAFVEFKDHNDAADAVEHIDQKMLCKRRVRVQLSSGENRKGGGPSRSRGQLCYECGRPGHLARDCNGRRGSGSGSGSGSGGRYPGKRYSRSRSRSYERKRSQSRSRSPPSRRSRSRSRSPYKGAGRSSNQD